MRQFIRRFGLPVLFALTILLSYSTPVFSATYYQWNGYSLKVPHYLSNYFKNGQVTPTPNPTPTTPTTPTPTPTTPTPTPTTPTTPTPNPAPTTNPSGMSASEDWMFAKLNEERVKAGLQPLQRDPELDRIARLKSQDLVDNNYFAHQSPTYGTVSQMLRSFGYQFRAAGENLSKSQKAEISHYRLMASDGHRTNILYPSYTHVGIGIVPYKSGVMVTQIFVIK